MHRFFISALFVTASGSAAAGELLHTTLDDATSVTTPAIGTGAGSSIACTPANDFVPALRGDGLRLDAIAERVLFPQTDGVTKNVDLHQGTMEFWYQPFYDHDDDNKYTLAGTGPWLSPGSLHLGKHNSSNDNDIFVIHFDKDGVFHQNNVHYTDYAWSAGVWIHLRLTWDFTVPSGVPNLHLYIDDEEVPFVATANGPGTTGPFGMGTESTTDYLYIGSRDVSGNIIASGIYDDFRIHDAPLPPRSPEASGSGGATSGAAATVGASSTSAGGGGSPPAAGDDAPVSEEGGCGIAGRGSQAWWLLPLLALGGARRRARAKRVTCGDRADWPRAAGRSWRQRSTPRASRA